MKNRSRIFALLCIAFLAGCASNGPTYRWVKIFEGKMPFEQASAQCDYEAHLQDKADSRADVGSGIGYIIMGMPHPTKAMCMRRFGWEARKIEQQEPQTKNTNSKTAEPAAEDLRKIEVFRDAAEKGDPVGQVNLAYSYLNGYGVNQSNALAYKWYTRAAEQVDVNKTMAQNAQANLGFMWHKGLGQPKDNVKAMMWLLLASSSDWDEAVKRKKEIEPLMPESEINEAKRIARVCIAKKYKGCDEAVGRRWKTCEASNINSENKDVVKMVEAIDLSVAFVKNIDGADARLYVFSRNDFKKTIAIDMDSTDDGMFKDKEKYYSYKARSGYYGRVEEVRSSGNILVNIGKDADGSFNMAMQCK